RTGSTLGTIGYMSPEQVQGKEIDHRSDLFSLGVVLYELITKQNPFKRDSEAATLKAVSDDTPHPVARYRADVPDGMQAIIDKALEKDRDTRYQTAKDLLVDTRRLLRNSSVSDYSLRPARRSISMTVLVGILVIVTISAGIIGTLNLLRDKRAAQLVSTFKKITSVGDIDKCDLSPDGSYFAYSRVLKDGRVLVMVDDIKGGNPLKVLESKSIICIEWSSDGEELLVGSGDDSSMTAHIMTRFGNILRRYVVPMPGQPASRTLQWHPNGTKLLFMAYDSNLVTIDRQSGDTSTTKLPFVFGRLLDRSPANDLMLVLVYTDESGVFLSAVRPDGSGLQKLVEAPFGQAVFSSNGDAVYYTDGIGIINRLKRLQIEPTTGKPTREPKVLIPNVPRCRFLSISADNRRLAVVQRVASSNLHKVLLTPERGQITTQTEALTSGTGFHSLPAISPDGRRIAFADYVGDSFQLFTVSVTGGERRQLTFSGKGNMTGDWSTDGQRLAYFRFADIAVKEVLLCVCDIPSSTSRNIAKHTIMGCSAGFDLDWAPGRHILTKAPYCGGIWLVDPESGDTSTLSLADSDVAIRDLQYSPDADLIAFHWDQDSQELDGIWIKSLVDGQQRLVIRADARVIGWGPDGDWIYYHYMDEDGRLNISRVHREMADVQTLAAMPWTVPNSLNWIDLAPDASWAVVEKELSQMDVWIIDDFDPNVD
ncbi:MAG: PD40 domain-containing protein, partial [Candidatus Zixiibacteriota bacterium]